MDPLGLYELLRRRCTTIFVCDSIPDPNNEFASLLNVPPFPDPPPPEVCLVAAFGVAQKAQRVAADESAERTGSRAMLCRGAVCQWVALRRRRGAGAGGRAAGAEVRVRDAARPLRRRLHAHSRVPGALISHLGLARLQQH
eukprot:1781081-Rhodomonas_salina.1